MRLTGGHAKGRVVQVKGSKAVRPTSSRVREAVFSVLGQDLSGERVLDAFGGSGVFGLEAWSRGAAVTWVERDRRNARALQAVVSSFGISGPVHCLDVLARSVPGAPFDGVLADPPYAMPPEVVLEGMTRMASRWLVYEHAATTVVPQAEGEWQRVRQKRFGGCAVSFFRFEGDPA